MMKRIKLLLWILSIMTASVAAQNCTVSGKVTDNGTGQGLAYLSVQVRNHSHANVASGLTNQEGDFLIKGLSAGTYELYVKTLGYYPVSQSFVLSREPVALSVRLKPALIPLGEVEVSSLRYNKLEKEVAVPIVVVPRESFARQAPATLSDVLSGEPGVALYRDGAWGTSINVRGLGENRFVALVDGNRIETASDVVAALSTLDVNEIDRVEIIKGAASSIYGTGALGGVVNILTNKGQYYDQFTIHGSAMGTYQTVNNLIGTHLAVESGSNKWKLRLSGGYRDAGNYRTPDGEQLNSQFTDQDLNATIGVKPAANQELEINAQYYDATDVGVPGGAPFAATATVTYPSQKRELISAKYLIKNLLPSMDELSVKVYHQYILRDVDMIPNSPSTISGNIRTTALDVTPVGKHHTTGATLESKWKTGEHGNLVAGIDLWQRKLETKREKYIQQEVLDQSGNVLKTNAVIRYEEPIPDSRFGSAGMFAQQEFSLAQDRLELTLGARIDRIAVANDQALDPLAISINGVYKDPVPSQRITFAADTIGAWSWSANAGALYHVRKNLDITANVGRSFRSPSLEERFKYIDLGSKVRLGDPNLKPEKGVFGDIGLRIWQDRLQVQANAFVNYLNDMIVETPGIFIYTLNTGTGAGLTDTLPALINANVDRALLTGFETSVHVQAFKNAVVYAKASYIRGRNLKENTDLPLIPPFSVGAGFRYYIQHVCTVEWTTNWVADQNKIAVGETATDSYFLSNLSLYTASKTLGGTSFQLFAGVDNLFDQSYRNHLATNRGLILTEPGRNVFVKLVVKY